MPEKLVKAWECGRCEYVWAKKVDDKGNVKSVPVCCPSCSNPYWNKPRIYKPREVKEDEQNTM